MSIPRLAVCLLGLAVIARPGIAVAQFVPYTAQYKEIRTLRSAGKVIESTDVTGTIVRTSDGSTRSVQLINGLESSGQIWQACGQIISVNYASKHAIITKSGAPPRHLRIPPDLPVGTREIAGIPAVGYAIHGDSHGIIWIDQEHDIMLKVEFHRSDNGMQQDYAREIVSVDFISPVDESVMAVPKDFKVDTSPDASTGANSCKGK